MSGWQEINSKQLLLLIPAILLLLLYWPALDHEFVWMDSVEIEQGNIILPHNDLSSAFTRPLHVFKESSAQGGQNTYYRPLQLLLVSSVYHRFGLQPRYFRLASFAMGATFVMAFTLLGWLLFRQWAPALVASLLVTAHPAGIEAFAWISGISEVMSAMFIVTSLIAALLFLNETDHRRVNLYALISWLLLVAALLSKEKSVVLPVLLLALMISLRGSARNEEAKSRANMLLTVQIVTVLGYLMVLRPMVIHSSLVGVQIEGSWLTQWLTALAMWPGAMADMFFPLYSTTSDVVRVVTSFSEPLVWLGLFISVGSLLLWFVLLKSRRGIAAFGLAWMWIAFLPTANLVHMIHARADRYMFLSLCGAALFVVALAPGFVRWINEAYRQRVLALVAVFTLGCLVVLTSTRLPDWQTTLTLFEKDVANDPDFREGRFHLALDDFDAMRYKKADEHLQVLLGQVEGVHGLISNVNLAGLYHLACSNNMLMGKYKDAIRNVKVITAQNYDISQNPGTQDCLGRAYEALGESQNALDVYLKIVQNLRIETPPGLLLAIARSYATLRHPQQAQEWLDKAGVRGRLSTRHRMEYGQVRTMIQSSRQE